MAKSTKTIFYSVQAAANMAGITPNTLRAWESRYELIKPDRSASGHRRYGQGDVERLQKVAALVRRGHAIGGIANLPDDRIDQLLAADPSEFASRPASPLPPYAQEHWQRLLASVETFDIARIVVEVKWLRTVLGVPAFVMGVALPLLAFVGKLVERNALDVTREHALSAVLRDQVGDALHSLQALSLMLDRKARPCIVFATPDGDMHEFGVLLGATLGVVSGHHVYYAGASLPAHNLAEAMHALNAPLLILGNSPAPTQHRRVPFEAFLRELDGLLKPTVDIWVGGAGDRPLAKLPSGRAFRYVNSLDELDWELKAMAESAQEGVGRVT